MTISTQEDLFFRAPPDWIDKSVIVLTAPSHPDVKYPPNVVVTRGALREGESIEQFAERSLYECAKQFEGFDLIERPQVHVGNRTAPSILYRWQSPRGAVTQHQVYLRGAEDTVLCFTTCALTPDYSWARAVFDEILASIRLPS